MSCKRFLFSCPENISCSFLQTCSEGNRLAESRISFFFLAGIFISGFVFLLCGASPAKAQKETKPASAPIVPPSLERIEHIYLPESQLSAIFKQDQLHAILPFKEFQALVARAREEKTSQPGYRTSVLSSAIYECRIDDDHLRAEVTLELSTPQPNEDIELNVTGWNVLSGKQGEETVAMARTGKDLNQLHLFLPKPGRQTVHLELSTRLLRFGNDQVVTIGLPTAAAAQFRLTLPAGKSLRMHDAVPERPASRDQAAHYDLAVGGLGKLDFRITSGVPASQSDVLTFASTAYGIRVRPVETSWTAKTELQVFGHSITNLVCHVPRTLEITRVESEGLESWDLAEEPDHPGHVTLALTYRQPFEGRRSVTVQGVLSQSPDHPWQVPALSIAGVTAHTGMILISHPANVRLQTLETQGVRALSELPSNPSVLDVPSKEERFAYAVWQENFILKLTATLKQQQVQAALTTLLIADETGLALSANIGLQTRQMPLFDARIRVPAEYRVLSATRDGTVVNWNSVPMDAGVNEFRIPLNPPLRPGKSTVITLQTQAVPENWPVQQTPVLISLPEVRLPQADMVEALYGIAVPEDLELAPLELTGLEPASQQDLNALNARLQLLGKSVRLGFSYQDPGWKGQLRLSRKPTLFTAETRINFRVDRETVFTALESTLALSGGGKRELQLQLSESAGNTIRFQLAPLQQGRNSVQLTEQLPGEVANGLRTWTLKFDRYLQGNFLLTTEVRLPRGTAETFSPPRLIFTEANAQSGFLAVEGPPDQQVHVTAKAADGQPLPAVDPVDLPAGRDHPRERIVAGFHFVRPDWMVQVTTTPFQRSPVISAIGHSAHLLSLWNPGSPVQHQARYNFTVYGMQSLNIRLPESARLWATILDGQAIEARTVGDAVQIPLSGLGPQPQHSLQVVYQTTPQPAEATGKFTAVPPHLSVLTGNGEQQPLRILQQDWDLYSPRDLVMIGSTGMFRTGPFLPLFSLKTIRQSGLILLILCVVLAGLNLLARLTLKESSAPFWLALFCLFAGLVYISLPAVQNAREASPALRNRIAQEAPFSSRDPVFKTPTDESQATSHGKEELSERRDLSLEQSKPVSKAAPLSEPAAAASPSEQPSRASSQPAAPPMPQLGIPLGIAGRSGDLASPGFNLNQDGAMKMRSGGLLSMTLNLTPSDDSQVRHFKYAGNLDEAHAATLQTQYLNRTISQVLVAALMLGTGLLGWWLRRAPRPCKTVLIFLTLVLPLAGLGMVPPLAGFLLRGVLLGGVLTLIGWGLHGLGCCPCWERLSMSKSCRHWGCASLFFLLMPGVLNPSFALADETLSPAFSTPHVIIPYRKLADIPDADRVYVPAALYQQLWKASHPEESSSGNISVLHAVAEGRGHLRMTQQKELYQGEVRFRWIVINFTDLPQTVPLPLKSPGLREPKLNGKAASLVPLSEGRTGILVPEKGIHVVDVSLALPGTFKPAEDRVTLETLPVASGTLLVEIPSPAETLELDVSSTGQQFGKISKKTTNGVQQFQVPIDRGGTLTLHWQEHPAPNVAEHDLQLETAITAMIEDAGLRLSHQFDLRVRKGSIDAIEFDIPAGLALRATSGTDISGWETAQKNNKKRIRITFSHPISNQTHFRIDLFQELALGSQNMTVDVQTLSPVGVERDTGMLAIVVPDYLRVRMLSSSALQQLDVSQFKPAMLPPGEHRSPQLVFRFLSHPFKLQLEAARRGAETRGTAEHGVQIGRRKVRIASRFELNLTGAAQRIVEIQLPSDFLTMDVACPHATDWYVVTSNGQQRLLIELDRPRTGTLPIGLEGHIIRNPSSETLTLQVPSPVRTDQLNQQLGVWCDEIYQPVLGKSSGWQSLPAPQLALPIRNLRSVAPLFGFQSSQANSSVEFQLRRVIPELQGDAGILIAVGEATVDYGLTLRWKIAHAAADQFTFTVPSWLGHLDLTGTGIRQVWSEPLDQGRTRWHLSLIEPVREQFLVAAAATIASPVDRTVQTPRLEFETQTDMGSEMPLTTQRQFAVLVNLSQNQLSPANPTQFESVTIDQLPLSMPADLVQQAMEIVRVRSDKIPAWSMQQMERAAATQAVIPASTLTTILQMDGSWRTRALFGIRNRGQQFLALKLPVDSTILSVFVRGEAGRMVVTQLGEEPIHLIALPQTSAADLSFDVAVVVAGQLRDPLNDRFRLRRQHINLPSIQVVSPKESAEFGVTVAQTVWNVFVPDELDAIPLEKNGITNVTWHGEAGWGAAEIQTIERIRSDIAEMKRIATSSQSRSQQMQAINNLKQLQAQLQQEQTNSRSYSSFGSVSSRLESESNAALAETDKALRELEAQSDKLQTDRRPPESLGQGNRGYIVQSNSSLLNSNGIQVQLENQSADESFHFDIPLQSRRSGPADGKKMPDEQAARSLLRQQLQDNLAQPHPPAVNLKGNASDISGAMMEGGPSTLQAPMEIMGRPVRRFSGQKEIVGGNLGTGSRSLPQKDFRTPDWIENGALLGNPRSDLDRDRSQANLPVNKSPQAADSLLAMERDSAVAPLSGQAASPITTQGLSVEMTLPESGQEMSFDKPGGNPMLTLAVRSRKTGSLLISGVWGILCLIFGMSVLRSLPKSSSPRETVRSLCLGIMIVAAGLALFFPETLSNWGLILFALAGVIRVFLPYVSSVSSSRP